MKHILFFLIGLFFFFADSRATTDKGTSDKDFAYWNKLLHYDLSLDGNWVFWRIQYEKNRDTLYIRNTRNGKQYQFASASMPEFSKDSQWIAFSVPAQEKTKDSSIPYQIKAIRLTDGKEKVFSDAERFSFSPNGKFLILFSNQGSSPTTLLYRLSSGQSKLIVGMGDYAFSLDGKYLVYAVHSKIDSGISQIELTDLSNFQTSLPDLPKGQYTSIKWTSHGVIMMKSRPENDILVWNPMRRHVNVLSQTIRQRMPAGMEISLHKNPVWSADGKTLFFDISRRRQTVARKESNVEVWHWKDHQIISRQRDRYYENLMKSDLCLWRPQEDRWERLKDSTMCRAYASANGNYILCFDDRRYLPQFREPLCDIKLKNRINGHCLSILDSSAIYPRFSPKEKYVYSFKNGRWVFIHTLTGRSDSVFLGADRPLVDTSYDGAVEVAPSWGSLGFIDDDKTFLFYDEYDLWSVRLPEMKYKRLTHGRESGIQFRKLGNEPITLNSNLILIGHGRDGQTGIYRYSADRKHVRLLHGRKSYSRIAWDAKKQSCLFAEEDNTESPKLYFSSDNGKSVQLIASTAKPVSRPKIRKSVLISYLGARGKTLHGALFFPSDYQPGRKYPMIVRLYERQSQQLDQFVYPSSRDAYNTMNYVLEGYFIFLPDIDYEVNRPGQSAIVCVRSAVDSVLHQILDVDAARIGVIGHSWGAYQSVYLSACTSLFAASIAGAPLTNLVSMYNSVYWENGKTNQELFETGQARMRRPWWEIPDQYQANSPIFCARQIKSPLLLSFGTDDKAVDWRQGLELYITMRRLRKPCILLAYPNEGHTISEETNERDQMRRFMEFFSTYLKGTSAPSWIEYGSPYQEPWNASSTDALPAQSRGK